MPRNTMDKVQQLHMEYMKWKQFFPSKDRQKKQQQNRQTVKTYTNFYNKMNTISRGKYVIGPGIELTKSKIATTRYGW